MFASNSQTNTTPQKERKKNKKAWEALLLDIQRRKHRCHSGGSKKARAKHKNRGKLLARERIDLLLDPGTAFLELSTLAAEAQYQDSFPSAGIITGIGIIAAREVVVIANDATVKGGTYVKETIRKHLRAQEIALENNLPAIYLVDSGGIYLPEQAKVFPDKEDFGRIFYNQARLSAEGIPQLAIVMGSCTAGGAYIPAMSDEAIIVEKQGTIFIGGPPLVKAATGETISAEELGGGEVHAKISGVVDHIAADDREAIEICRKIAQTFPKPFKKPIAIKEPLPPQYPSKELLELIPLHEKSQPDAHEIIARIVDKKSFLEFKADYAPSIVTGIASIEGYPSGIIANNGVIYAETARKATHFIELCEHRGIPLIFLQNITGFIVGKKFEHAGIAKDGAKLIHAVANANVPKLTIITGGSYGAGNYAMAGRAYNPSLLFMWPNAKIGVMGGEQAASVLMQIKMNALQKKDKTPTEHELKTMKNDIRNKYFEESSAIYSTSRLWDDGIISPLETREVLALALETTRNATPKSRKRGVYRM